MTKLQKKERIAELERLIQGYQASYYNGEAEITDAEFDLLWDELKQRAPDSPVLATIGADGVYSGADVADTIDGFPKAAHLIPMGSQDKAAGPDAFRAWILKTKAPAYVVQFKLDGASLELQYERGSLIRAVTRGDGVIGDDITQNALRMGGVISSLNTDFSGGVRGEVLMPHAVWKEKHMNKANCRNAANGIMRRKDGVGCEDLVFRAYDVSATGNDGFFKHEIEKVAWLTSQGFTVPETKEFTDAESIIAYREEIADMRRDLDVDIDGLVIKDCEINMDDLRRVRPERQIAFKFELESAYSVLRDVEWSEAGATYTPVGIIDPVRLAGTTVKRASLNNPGVIRAMNLKIGSVVSVVKRGEIIPKIERLAPAGALPHEDVPEETDIVFPATCSVCGTALVDEDSRLYCPNTACPKLLLHRLHKWIKTLDIRELGDKLIRRLFDSGRVTHISDLYTLTADELAVLDYMGTVSAKKVVKYIRTVQAIPLVKFIAGFDFEGVGETIMEKIAGFGFNTLEKLRAADADALAIVEGIGEVTAKTIVQGMRQAAAEMDAVLNTGVITIAAPPDESKQPLKGLSFCFTGELLTMKRSQAEEKVNSLGGSSKTSVVKGLSYLVTNDTDSGSAKNRKARDMGVPIIDEKQFLALIHNAVTSCSVGADIPEPPRSPVQGELFYKSQ
ncbi:MAG: NAD-dependent DNA ligase LigA [Treponema sp.]|jgi:DNA ligase (NAD+)|nr:NAD-dependent DNA ligase LigA [Treponema sp.]